MLEYEYLSDQTILLKFSDFRILLDPEFGIDCDYELVDVILISTYKSSFICHLVEYCGFQGKVLMTGPTLELLILYTRENYNQFTNHDFDQLKLKIQPIYYHHLQRFMDFEIRAIPAGTGIGFSNWSIRYGSTHFVYSHCWTKAAKKATPMDIKTLMNCDVLFCTRNLVPMKPIVNGKTWKELWPIMYEKVKQKGNIIVVTEPIESMFDLLENLYHLIDSAGIQHVPIHIVSPTAKHSLSLMNVFSEWMNQERHQQTMVAQSWFLFDLLEKSRIICHSDTNSLLEYPEPRVIVCTHKTMNSCLELSNLYNHFLCLVADSDTRDVPISQFSDCQFILYKDVMQYSSLEQLDSFLRSLQPKYLINSKVKGQITLDVSLNLTISNQVSFSN